MTEQDLDGTQIGPGFEQMGDKGVPQGVRMNRFKMPASRAALRQARKTALGPMGRVPAVFGNNQLAGRSARQ